MANKKIAIATLNVEKTLNSLTLEMVDLLFKQLLEWQQDDSISCVFLHGAGPKAFCAGGDVQQLYHSALSQPGGPCEYAETFFEHEYRLDYLLHTFAKPIICWGHGIVMGGGLGLMAGCSHRIVTERTRMAMPEITIGLFPDVGGSWFLNRMPGRIGLFLGLTAAHMNAADCIYTGLADRFIENAQKDTVLAELVAIDWQPDALQHKEQITEVLRHFEQQNHDARPADNIAVHYETIQQLTDQNNFYDIVDAITGYQSDDSWMTAAASALAHGSPISACSIYKTLNKTLHMSLAEVFQFELILVTNIVRNSDFVEGVRALLIDKDKSPTWQYDSVRAVPSQVLQKLITPPWPTNPLADL
ncbi:enoyl-CoA hydratase/isomerase family protein [Aliiglaciecola sp. 3_MG-2023]|uniref:enoyl-CoA hydratase/isomerase family protein n=1 Tax=Aliiglaciecola sp. 3_MG-2023 TaxID=3062644 RepID=UPI0026E115F9|nr:enoyl-CoA hydratase/isomerase family protein [Aliiglaciecola sp. 3_MG-2023]MDO6693112.1 enoyl-CoA hydratase/isomerase family protein [Aliiglaciecola sp. 3_MG-2023]